MKWIWVGLILVLMFLCYLGGYNDGKKECEIEKEIFVQGLVKHLLKEQHVNDDDNGDDGKDDRAGKEIPMDLRK